MAFFRVERYEETPEEELARLELTPEGRWSNRYHDLVQIRNAQWKEESERMERLMLSGLTVAQWDSLSRDPLEQPDYTQPTTTQRLLKRIGG